MTSRQLLLCMEFTSGYGAEPGARRLPGANLSSYTDMDRFVRYAQAAERGKIQLLFFAVRACARSRPDRAGAMGQLGEGSLGP